MLSRIEEKFRNFTVKTVREIKNSRVKFKLLRKLLVIENIRNTALLGIHFRFFLVDVT